MIDSADRAEPSSPNERRRYLAHSAISISRRDRLAMAGILRPDTRADLAPDALVSDLLPHDADLVLERTDPDLVLVETGAFAAGHPWVGAGDPSAADVARRLLRLLDVTRAIGRPSVMWWTGPRHAMPGLIPFESRFDHVVSSEPGEAGGTDLGWDPGVQLARFDPIGIQPDRPVHPVAHGRWEEVPRQGVRAFTEAALDALADDRLDLWIDSGATGATWLPERIRSRGVRRVDVDELPDLYRSNGLFLADPLTRQTGGPISASTLRQLASGARVVSGPNETLAAALGGWIEGVSEPGDVGKAVRAAAASGPRTGSAQRALLRTLFLHHDTTRAITTLAHLAGVSAPTPRRHICVVARLDGNARPADLLDAVILQRHRPTEALIDAADPADAMTAIRELELAGIPARALPPSGPERGLARRAASQTSAGWLWLWSSTAEHGPLFLLDSLVAGMISGASAIGGSAGSQDGFHGSGRFEAHVVSREAAASMPDTGIGWSTAWSDRGATAYTVGSDPEEG